jgi:hypothetical protein
MTDITTLGATAAVAIIGYKSIEHIVKLFIPKITADNKQKIDIAVLQELQKIGGNDIAHIREILDEHTKNLEEIKVRIAEIRVKLDEFLIKRR